MFDSYTTNLLTRSHAGDQLGGDDMYWSIGIPTIDPTKGERQFTKYFENLGYTNKFPITGTAMSTTGVSGTDVNLSIGTQNNGIVTFGAQTQIGITPTAANDIVNKSYVDAQGTPTLQTLSIDDVDLSLKRRVITNASELIQKESAYFDGTDATEGFEFINGTMQINIDKSGDLVIETT